jgi:hypothetical protein
MPGMRARCLPGCLPQISWGRVATERRRFRGSRPALEVRPERVTRLGGRMGLGFPRAGHGRKEPHAPRRLHRRHRRDCRRDHRCPRRADLHRSSRGPKAPLRHGKAGAWLRPTSSQRETNEGRAPSRSSRLEPDRPGPGLVLTRHQPPWTSRESRRQRTLS